MSPAAPRPGTPVAGSTTGRPIMAAFDFLSRRWALRIIWELHRASGPLTFRALREAAGGLSSSVLTRRLAELTELRVVDHAGAGYQLTRTGERLVASLLPLQEWARGWAREMRTSAA
jgi:DNA-binding HxlR family transcriptional regulator